MEENGSYYNILGVNQSTSANDVRRAYRKLAMEWHPDRWERRNPSMLGEAKRKFQQIQEAYEVLGDKRKRTLYDAGLYDPDDDEVDEGFSDFVQEMIGLMASARTEGESCSSRESLEKMLMEIVQSFGEEIQQQPWPCEVQSDPRCPKRPCWDSTLISDDRRSSYCLL